MGLHDRLDKLERGSLAGYDFAAYCGSASAIYGSIARTMVEGVGDHDGPVTREWCEPSAREWRTFWGGELANLPFSESNGGSVVAVMGSSDAVQRRCGVVTGAPQELGFHVGQVVGREVRVPRGQHQQSVVVEPQVPIAPPVVGLHVQHPQRLAVGEFLLQPVQAAPQCHRVALAESP